MDMDLIGRWTLKGVRIPTENGMTFYTKETLPEEYEEIYAEAVAFDLEFLEDGTYNMIGKAEGELAEEAKESGMESREDGYVVAMSAKWEDRDGTIYYDSGVEGTILDEEIDPFLPVEFDENGYFLFNFGMLAFEKV